MRVLVFDTETTGLSKSKIIGPDTLSLWPHIVQFSYVIYDTDVSDITDTYDKIVKLPSNISITEEVAKIHGITNEISDEKGIEINDVLNVFFQQLKTIDLLVGHNVSFDINMIMVELLRGIYECSTISKELLKTYKKNLCLLTNFKIYCTLKESITLCNIKATDRYGKEYIKFPKLLELHKVLFTSEPNNLHNSFNDILVTLRCFIKLKFDSDINTYCEKYIKITDDIGLFNL